MYDGTRDARDEQDERDAEGLLLATLQAEERLATDNSASERSAARQDAHARYRGEPYGDEVEGRSKVTTREVFENIEWMRPDLERLFVGGDRIVDVEASSAEEEACVETQADYLNHIVFQDNEGAELISDWLFDGLLERTGYIAAFWKDREYSAPEEISGLATVQIQELMQDRTVQLDDVDSEQGEPDEAHPDGLFWSAKMRRVEKEARCEIEVFPPENMLIPPMAGDLDEERYIGAIIPTARGELERQFPEKAAEIRAYNNEEHDQNETDKFARHGTNYAKRDEAPSGNEAADELNLMLEHVRYDLDGDGYAELLRVYRLGDILLEAEEVAEQPFACWSPITISHKLEGMSVADITADQQRIKTVATRSALDAMYQAIAPRMLVSTKVKLDDLLAVRPGAAIRVDTTTGDVGGHAVPLVVPDVSGSALQMIEYVDQATEKRTGVSRNSQGLDPDALNKTASGQAMMQSASNKRLDKVARAAANGLQRLFRKINRLVVRHQNAARVVKIAGKWTPVDPRSWNADAKIKVNVGQGSRETEIAYLMQIGQLQSAAIQQYGVDNPAVTPRELYNTTEKLVRAMGYKSATPFFKEPPPDWKPQQADPNAEKAKADMAKVHADMQAKAAEMHQALQLKTLEMQQEMQLEREKMASEFATRRAEMEKDFALKREQMAREFDLKREQIAMEGRLKLATAQIAARAKMNGEGGGDMGSDVRFGGEVG